ncbi:MAG: metallophosphoesterase family protein [Aquabacterium sp.]|uniref:metallophosphoesterase family protein n=1 Tax=Aquabacterium sp. TaxID=1872578 RepID=UPI003BC26DA3
MPKFIHTADWQIGRQFTTFPPEDALPLAEARLHAVERLAALAVQHQVDAVLVAGDVFDMQTVSDRTIRRMFHAMQAYEGPWVMISGNHDAALAESVWTRAVRLGAVPPNVHLALSPEPVVWPDRGLAVLPAPLTQRHTYGDTTAWFDQAQTPASCVRVGLAHGCVQGVLPDDIDSANPIAPDRAEQARLDYLALGDWHGCKRIQDRVWYAGTPETDRFRGNESGQALLVNIPAPGVLPEVTPLAVGQHPWHQLTARLEVDSDVDVLLNTLQGLASSSVVSLSVSGHLTMGAHARVLSALAKAGARFRHLSCDTQGLTLLPTADELASVQADGYVAEILQDLRHAQGTPGEGVDTAAEAMTLLMQALLARQPVTITPPGGAA